MQEAFHAVIRIKQRLARPNSSASSPPYINTTDAKSTFIEMNPLTSIISCLTGQSAPTQSSLQVSEINTNSKLTTAQPVLYADDAASQFIWLAKPMAEAVKRATNTALEFAKEHPVYAGLIAAGTIVAIGVLVEFELIWVLRALGFDEIGPRVGSFAARWMSSLEKVPKGSIYSYLQRLGMKIAK
ncbi:lincomycin-condensing protein [Fusarium globosum]|uniref:Lincomycin-condensing protein n=1 Tax=Fusarium globosum TaxID=78864 RepID=A0A8H5XYP4_9HYPO|nr:lincomycin-condensing protein [Fusarium globosum]